MKKRIMLDKRIGQTPLEAVNEWKEAHPRYKDVPASYAGRLDPMASGKLLILLGDECKKQKEYTKLDKEYLLEVLLDVGSDTGDVLGIVERTTHRTEPTRKQLKRALTDEVGTHEVPYPIYSSKTVGGKPLFLYALEGIEDTISLPVHTEEIYSLKLRRIERVSHDLLSKRIQSLLAVAPTSTEPSKLLGADFRITEVRASWEKVLTHQRSYVVIHLRVSCGPGTYMRSLAERIGVALGTRALAFAIRRTKIYLPIFR